MQMLNGLHKFSCIAMCLTLMGCASTSQPATTQASKDELVVQSGETNGVKLTVRMKRHYAPGDPITVDFTLENNRDELIVLDHDDERHDIWMRLKTNRWVVVPFTDMGLRFTAGSPYNFNSNLSRHLDPHGTMNWQYKLRDYFVISKPGGYLLYALRTVDGVGTPIRYFGDNEEVDVGPVRFYVSDNGK
jgi:hypothetical protein